MVRTAGSLFRCTGKLRQSDDRDVQFLGHDLQVSGNITDFLHAALSALGTLHQLQVVDDDKADLFLFGILVDGADLRLDLRHRNAGGIVHIDGCVIQKRRSLGKIVPVGVVQTAGTECLAVDVGSAGKDTVGQLFAGHFQAENDGWNLLLTRHVGGDVQREGGLAHTGAGGQNDKVRTAQAGKHGVQVVETCGDAGELVAVGTAQLLHGVDNFQDGFPDGLDAGFIAAAADVINLLFGAFQQHVGILAGGCLAQNAAGGFDQAAGLVLFPDDL